MDLGIRGRRAIVNGGSAGLGRGSVVALANEGVELFVSARGEERLLRSCEDISRETGASITPLVADFSTVEGREKILAACPDPDILVGTCSPPPFTDDYRSIGDSDWQQGLETGLLAPIAFMKAVVDGMAARGWGRVVNIASGAAKYPHETRILSGAPRAALANYCVAVAKAVARHGVTVNLLLPVMHHTDGIRAVYQSRADANGTSCEEEMQCAVETFGIPAGRFGEENDFGGMVAMFCSHHANYVTGQSLVVDGGVSNSIF